MICSSVKRLFLISVLLVQEDRHNFWIRIRGLGHADCRLYPLEFRIICTQELGNSGLNCSAHGHGALKQLVEHDVGDRRDELSGSIDREGDVGIRGQHTQLAMPTASPSPWRIGKLSCV